MSETPEVSIAPFDPCEALLVDIISEINYVFTNAKKYGMHFWSLVEQNFNETSVASFNKSILEQGRAQGDDKGLYDYSARFFLRILNRPYTEEALDINFGNYYKLMEELGLDTVVDTPLNKVFLFIVTNQLTISQVYTDSVIKADKSKQKATQDLLLAGGR